MRIGKQGKAYIENATEIAIISKNMYHSDKIYEQEKLSKFYAICKLKNGIQVPVFSGKNSFMGKEYCEFESVEKAIRSIRRINKDVLILTLTDKQYLEYKKA